MEEQKQCRICLDEEPLHELISPCLCRGGSRYIHRECLQNWRQANVGESYFRCNTCLFRYRFQRLWWGYVLESRWTSGVIAFLLLSMGGFMSGQLSAKICNVFWAYFSHAPPHIQWEAHRLQILFHSLFWIALPGFFLFLRDVIQHAPELAAPGPSQVYFMPAAPAAPATAPTQSDQKDQTKRVVPYESPSGAAWFVVLMGAARFGYSVFRVVHNRAIGWCAHAQQMVENV